MKHGLKTIDIVNFITEEMKKWRLTERKGLIQVQRVSLYRNQNSNPFLYILHLPLSIISEVVNRF